MDNNIISYKDVFTLDEKLELFDKIAEKYFDRNFGTMGKADFETLLFAEYFKAMVSSDKRELSEYTDRALGKQLGLTASRVASLKERAEIKYMQDYDWKKAFLSIIKNVRAEENKIVINIPERMLYIKLEEELDKYGSFADTQLNPKIFKAIPGDFVHLMLICSQDDTASQESIIQSFKQYLKENSDNVLESPDNGVSFGNITIGMITDAVKNKEKREVIAKAFQSIKIKDVGNFTKDYILPLVQLKN